MNLLYFWDITPYEFSLSVNAYVDKQKVERDEEVTMVYLGAYLNRVKQMPTLESLLTKKQPEPTKERTAEDLLEKLKQINAALGGTVT